MPAREILLLGNPLLYRRADPVERMELTDLEPIVADLHGTLMAFRSRYGAGRAIAAPQIGVMKRLVYMHIAEPLVFVNPVLDRLSDDTMEIWDDCMSFPELLVRVRRHRTCRISYLDMGWAPREQLLDEDLSELLQHECDHLDGIVATARAVGENPFAMRSQRHLLPGRQITPAARMEAGGALL